MKRLHILTIALMGVFWFSCASCQKEEVEEPDNGSETEVPRQEMWPCILPQIQGRRI